MSWDGKSRGNVLGQRIFVFTLKQLGLRFAYAILYVVALYFFLFVAKPRKSLFYLYNKRLGFGVLKSYYFVYQNMFSFGQNLLDKFAIMSGQKNQYSTNNEDGGHYLDQMVREGKGGVLLSAHIGNFEVGGQLLERLNGKVNVIMHDAEHQKIKGYLESKGEKKSFNIIAIKNDFSHVVMIKNALANNEFICLHGDRFMEGADTLEVDFLGEQAKFPKGPFVIATRFGAPVSFVYVVKTGLRSYSFSATEPKIYNRKIEIALDEYVAKLESIVKKHPKQWFNHFPFWNK